MQILAADALRNWIAGREDDSVAEACIAGLDLLLRWAVVRLAEGNTQTLVGVTGMLKALFDLLAEQGYRLSDAEVKAYMPGLVEKCGQPTPQMKAECRDLMRRVTALYPATKCISYIQEGLNSKNNRTRVTCAEEISYLVDREGPRVYSGAKCDVLPALAKLVAEPGKEIRAAALEALGVVYTIEGDAIMKRLGNLNGQQQGILGDRLKTVDRDLAKKGLAAGYRRAEFDAPLQSFANPAEQRAEFEKCLRVLCMGQIDDVIEVMKLLCYELMDLQRSHAAVAAGAAGAGGSAQAQAVWGLLQERSDELVQLLTAQTQQVFVAASASMRLGPLPPASCRACKYALNTLMNIFGSNALPSGLSQATLAGLVRVLLMRLVDDHLGRQPEGEALLKALNVLMLKILENSNRNFTFSALLALLLDVPPELAAAAGGGSGDGQQQQQSALAMRWADLVVKCLIKSTKALPQVIQTMDLRALLLSLHGFFEALGVEEIRRRSNADDKPLRMVKTILHELCKLKGTEIYKYTTDIPQHGSVSGADGKSVIFPYIDLNIQTLQGNASMRASMQQTAGAAAAAAAAANGSSGSSNPVTPGRGLLAAAAGGAAAAGNGVRPAAAAAAPKTPGSAMRRQQQQHDGIMNQMAAVFGRLSALMTAGNKDGSEKRAVMADINAMSVQHGMPIDELMEQYLPDTSPNFKAWIMAEVRRFDAEQQQHGQQQQQQGYAAGSAAAEAPGSLAGVYSSSGAAAAAGPAGNATMEALKARMSQLQSEKTRILTASPTKQPAAAAAAAGIAAAPIAAAPAPPAVIAAVGAGVGGSVMGPGSIASAAAGEGPAGGISSGGGSGRNLQDLRSRMKGLAGL
ncbi:hypothetical protein OEZ85_004930 [Tetradesmus obliquus]|uniref:TOG domain-containing protein n=1 Tax=Tetradesmus obliquus TaxID=3088 RepID=A0ABY8UGZ7_TETOB|nr:hypothetical protein OEZ85_004930 [Tetradesmus obliquus]